MMVILFVSFISGLFFLGDQAFNQVPHYSIAIDHVSGLDLTTELGHWTTLGPELNLTLRVVSVAH